MKQDDICQYLGLRKLICGDINLKKILSEPRKNPCLLDEFIMDRQMRNVEKKNIESHS